MQRSPAPALPDWLNLEVPFERYTIDVGGYAMHVMEIGSGRPVLMQHGNPTWGFLYRKVVRELSGESFRIVLPDLIGLGLSDKPGDGGLHTVENHAAWVGAAIDALDIDGAIFVGQDWGGPIGGLAFADRADRLAGMVMLNSVMDRPREGFRPTAFHKFAAMPMISDIAFRVGGFPQRALWPAQGDRSSIRGRTRRAYTWPLRRFGDRTAPLALARMVPSSQTHFSIPALSRLGEFVRGFEGPAAIVWGDADPVLGRARGRMERLLPNAPVTRTRAGHFLQEEVPAEIAAAIRDVAGRI